MAKKGFARVAAVVSLLVLARPCVGGDWFGSPVMTTTPYSLEMIRAADLTQDGLSDVVVQGLGLDSLIAYQADRDGRMTLVGGAFDFGSLGTHQEYALFDYRNDGQLDLVLNSPWENQLDVYAYENGQFWSYM